MLNSNYPFTRYSREPGCARTQTFGDASPSLNTVPNELAKAAGNDAPRNRLHH